MPTWVEAVGLKARYWLMKSSASWFQELGGSGPAQTKLAAESKARANESKASERGIGTSRTRKDKSTKDSSLTLIGKDGSEVKSVAKNHFGYGPVRERVPPAPELTSAWERDRGRWR